MQLQVPGAKYELVYSAGVVFFLYGCILLLLLIYFLFCISLHTTLTS